MKNDIRLRPFKRRGCEIVGDAGILLWQSEGKNPEVCSVKLYSQDHWQILFSSDKIDVNSSYIELIKQFLTAIQEKNSNLLDARFALQELEVAIKSVLYHNNAMILKDSSFI